MGARRRTRIEVVNSSESKDSAAIRLPKTSRPVSAESPIGPVLSRRSLWIRYSAALLTIGLVTVLRFAAVPIMGAQAPLLPFGFAVFLAAYLGGLGPALAATCFASLASTALYANLSDPDDALAWAGHVALFTTLGFLVSFMMHRLQHSYCIQRGALAAAKAREEQLQTITDAMPALIAYVDADHRFRFNNKGYQEWFALSRDELLGKHAREVLGEDVYRQLMPRIETALSGLPVSFETEIPYLAAGTRHVSAHYVPDRSSDGTIRGYFAVHSRRLRADTQGTIARRREASIVDCHACGPLRCIRVGHRKGDEYLVQESLELHGLQPGEFKGTNDGGRNVFTRTTCNGPSPPPSVR